MKQIYYSLLALILGACMVSCEKTGGQNPEGETKKDAAIREAATEYVNNNVLVIYQGLADASAEIYDACAAIKANSEAGKLTDADIRKAADAWLKARKYWEQSEAFLYGPVADEGIDPRIDSWPLDKTGMDAILANESKMAEIEKLGAAYFERLPEGYGMFGFHALEYLIFASDNSSKPVRLRTTDSYAKNELIYLTAAAEDLKTQTARLVSLWRNGYAQTMTTVGNNEQYRTWDDVAEEILQGCIDIADEVGNTKMGTPHNASSEGDRDYIESPYSLNSIQDFQDNIVSIKNSYAGGRKNLSLVVQMYDKDLDSKCLAAIENAYTKIGLIPEPFAESASKQVTADAIDACNELVKVLEEINSTLREY